MTRTAPIELTCVELVALVTEYLEEALTPAERERFEHHLVYCVGCIEYLQQIRDAMKLAGAAKPAEVLTQEAEDKLLSMFRGLKK
ncbi:MAG: zf-HC2 domain-containing protein [Deltaproteobacteria bacterium]|nr:zf-HC2 domain-containing protein [Deltaproteobacteria bacterium]